MPDINEELVRRMQALETRLKRVEIQKPLYKILNVHFQPQITSSQNNYDVGNYDMIILQASGAHTITGFSGGVDGRWLYVLFSAANSVTFAHNSASSDSANRILTYSGANITITARQAVLFVYDNQTATQWRLLFKSP